MSRILIAIIATTTLSAATLSMDSSRGDQLFQSQNCVQCHQLKGVGGNTAPDLGRILDRGYTPADLASTMWNHAPTMWSAIRERGLKAGEEIDPQAAADLFASFYSARYFEMPGDAGRGKRLFTQKTCANCHGITTSPDARAKPIDQWQTLAHPVALVGTMWNHSPDMWRELSEKKLVWPVLTSQDLSDLLVYLRNGRGRANSELKDQGFRITSGAEGEKLFRIKGCAGCHDPQKPLTPAITLTGVAAAMWNHASFLNGRLHAEPPRIDTEEMRELVSTYWAKQFFGSSGNGSHGKRIFAAKHCIECHSGKGPGPVIAGGSGDWNGIGMVSALWRHGPSMLTQMEHRSIPWPMFRAGEMSDLIAYLNAKKE